MISYIIDVGACSYGSETCLNRCESAWFRNLGAELYQRLPNYSNQIPAARCQDLCMTLEDHGPGVSMSPTDSVGWTPDLQVLMGPMLKVHLDSGRSRSASTSLQICSKIDGFDAFVPSHLSFLSFRMVWSRSATSL